MSRTESVKNLPENSLLTLSLLFALCLHSPSPAQEAGGFVFQGRKVSKQYADAINAAQRAEPLIREGKYAEAEALMKPGIGVITDYAPVIGNYALVLNRQGRHSEALPYYAKAAELDPKNEGTWIGWSGDLIALGRNEESLKICRDFLKRFPNSAKFAQMKTQVANLENEIKRQGKQINANADDFFAELGAGTPRHWLNRQLKVCIVDGADVPKWRPEFKQILQDAFLEWSSKSNQAVTFEFVDKADDANISCEWTDDVKRLRNPAEQGQTDTKYKETGEMVKAKITLMTYVTVNPEMRLTNERMKHTALHEIGHALGIHGHSSNPKDIMYYATVETTDSGLSDRDVNTLRRLYPSPKEAN